VADLLEEAIDSIAPAATFKIAIFDNLPSLPTNRLLLFQVFLNLVGNSINHHNRLNGSIQVGWQDRDDVYEFAVSDDGPGIALKDRDRIFKIFQSVNPQNRTDSTGIGLAITSGRLRQR
jgi:signal transduction histidine kinase